MSVFAQLSGIANPQLFLPSLPRIRRSKMAVEACLQCEEGGDSGQRIEGYKGIYGKHYRIAYQACIQTPQTPLVYSTGGVRRHVVHLELDFPQFGFRPSGQSSLFPLPRFENALPCVGP